MIDIIQDILSFRETTLLFNRTRFIWVFFYCAKVIKTNRNMKKKSVDRQF